MGYLPADSVVEALPSNEGGAGSTPRQENKIQRASWPKKQKCNAEAILYQIK